jgi:hypothetical protein
MPKISKKGKWSQGFSRFPACTRPAQASTRAILGDIGLQLGSPKRLDFELTETVLFVLG